MLHEIRCISDTLTTWYVLFRQYHNFIYFIFCISENLQYLHRLMVAGKSVDLENPTEAYLVNKNIAPIKKFTV